MPSCAIHHNDDASKTISNASEENGKEVAVAQRNCADPRDSSRGTFAADRISGSFMSIPTHGAGLRRIPKRQPPVAGAHFEDIRILKINRLENCTRLNASRIHLNCH